MVRKSAGRETPKPSKSKSPKRQSGNVRPQASRVQGVGVNLKLKLMQYCITYTSTMHCNIIEHDMLKLNAVARFSSQLGSGYGTFLTKLPT